MFFQVNVGGSVEAMMAREDTANIGFTDEGKSDA